MSCLHLIQSQDGIARAATVLREGDAIVLFPGCVSSPPECPANISLYQLAEGKVPGIAVLSDAEFIALCSHHSQVLSW